MGTHCKYFGKLSELDFFKRSVFLGSVHSY